MAFKSKYKAGLKKNINNIFLKKFKKESTDHE